MKGKKKSQRHRKSQKTKTLNKVKYDIMRAGTKKLLALILFMSRKQKTEK